MEKLLMAQQYDRPLYRSAGLTVILSKLGHNFWRKAWQGEFYPLLVVCGEPLHVAYNSCFLHTARVREGV